jgi:hypothetical protein
MKRLEIAGATLIVLGLMIACGKDSERQQVTAPGARQTGTTISASQHSGDADADGDENGKIAIRDDCDPRDPAWAPTGGCLLRRGDVTFAEFAAELSSPLSVAVIGHQAWRNDPSYVEVFSDRVVRVSNEGGRAHTFTEVAQFGGGRVPNPALNKGLTTAPECPGSVDIAPGGRMDLQTLAPGNHRFQCCIHPWMRALVKVKDRNAAN